MTEPRLDKSLTQVSDEAFWAKGATVLGDVHIGKGSSVWFSAVIRGDVEEIRLGERVNVQDGTIVHADSGFPTVVEDDVTIGHRCVIHGCKIGRRALIGMSATVMNGAEIGEECIVGAGALVSEGKVFPPRSLILGVPAKVKRELTEMEVQMLEASAVHYAENGAAFKAAGYDERDA